VEWQVFAVKKWKKETDPSLSLELLTSLAGEAARMLPI
jgi:hypothetical protein